MLDPAVETFALAELPPRPARVLEVGAGDGALAEALRGAGYDVLAIDPASETPAVRPVALAGLDEPPESFDAAVAVVSLHHVAPLDDSCRHLAGLLRPGGVIVVDEFDVERLDERAAAWWLANRAEGYRVHAGHAARTGHAAHAGHHDDRTPGDIVADLRHHCHPLADVRAALAPWFELAPPVFGAYLYRWAQRLDLRKDEEDLVAAGRLPMVGVRFTGIRR